MERYVPPPSEVEQFAFSAGVLKHSEQLPVQMSQEAVYRLQALGYPIGLAMQVILHMQHEDFERLALEQSADDNYR